MRSYAHVAAIISRSYSEPCLAYGTSLVYSLLMLSKQTWIFRLRVGISCDTTNCDIVWYRKSQTIDELRKASTFEKQLAPIIILPTRYTAPPETYSNMELPLIVRTSTAEVLLVRPH